jgi:hypothetical protein
MVAGKHGYPRERHVGMNFTNLEVIWEMSIELSVWKYVSKETRNSTEKPSKIQSFCKKIEKPSLNLKVREALNFKKQGHFDKAMLGIAEANRDQVTAIKNDSKPVGAD